MVTFLCLYEPLTLTLTLLSKRPARILSLIEVVVSGVIAAVGMGKWTLSSLVIATRPTRRPKLQEERGMWVRSRMRDDGLVQLTVLLLYDDVLVQLIILRLYDDGLVQLIVLLLYDDKIGA
jgi:hypothetical protein